MHTLRRAAKGPQYPELFAVNAAPRRKMPDAVSLARGLTTAPTGGEAHHVG
jgi:hypothetical protein